MPNHGGPNFAWWPCDSIKSGAHFQNNTSKNSHLSCSEQAYTVATQLFGILYEGNELTFVFQLKLVSKELNHFGAIAAFFRDWAPGTLTGGA